MTFRWLHVSDFHAGLDSTAQELHLYKLVEYVQETLKEGFIPDWIFVTGDIAQAGEKDQYSLFRLEFLEKLEAILPATEIIFVPGNHDLVRPKDPQQYNRFYFADESKCQIYDSSEAAKGKRADLAERFSEFSLLPGCDWIKGENGFRHIPGKAGLSVDILCFNTSWIAWGDGDGFVEKGNLPIGVCAIEQAFRQLTPGHSVIALGHHPLDWLTEPSRDALIRELRKRDGIYLCGHEHQAKLDAYRYLEDNAYQLRAGATFLGRLPDGESWTNSLIWGELVQTQNSQMLRLRPRCWSNKHGWRLWSSNLPGDPKDGGWYEYTLTKGSPTITKQATHSLGFPPAMPATDSSRKVELPDSIEGFLDLLESKFEFTFQKTSRPQGDGKYVVFWPVRARQPTLVHAMQAFSAAGLTRYDAVVLLVIDDLAGQQRLPTTDLEGAIKRWFSRVGAKPSSLHIFRLSELQSEIEHGKQWIDLITKWFAWQTEYKLSDILSVSKLDEKKISEKKARKLLTPTLIWSAFSVLMEKHKTSRFVTLGGADEKPLWEAWRSCIDDTSVASHVYNPEVKDEKGHRFNLDEIGWVSLTEIRQTISECLNAHGCSDLVNPPTYWLPFVAFQSCVALPALIAGESVADWNQLLSSQGGNTAELSKRLAEKINAWYLKTL